MHGWKDATSSVDWWDQEYHSSCPRQVSQHDSVSLFMEGLQWRNHLQVIIQESRGCEQYASNSPQHPPVTIHQCTTQWINHHHQTVISSTSVQEQKWYSQWYRGKSCVLWALTCLKAKVTRHPQNTWDLVTLSTAQLLSRSTGLTLQTHWSLNRINAVQLLPIQCSF